MIKYFLSALTLMAIATTSFGQTTKTKLDQVKPNPVTTENAVKADVQVSNNKNVINSSEFKTARQKIRAKKLQRRKISQRTSK